MVLSQFYPQYSWFFLGLVALDIMSHFARVYRYFFLFNSIFSFVIFHSSLASGATSHKSVGENQSWLMRIYYTNRLVLGFLCFGNEGFFIMLYMLHFWGGPMIPVGSWAAELLQSANGQVELVRAVVWLFFFPIMAVKQFINFVQLQQSCLDIVALDELEMKISKQKRTN